MNLDDLYEVVGPSVEGPMPLIILTDGWLEASDTIARVHETIVHRGDLVTIAEFDTDQLLDQRARRPMLNVVDGVVQGVEWPQLELAVGTDSNDNPFMLLHGPEPDFGWRPFARAVATVAGSIGVTMAYNMGAYPAPRPHSRPPVISATASDASLLIGREHTTGSIVVPVGIFAAITEELKQYGVPSFGLWAQIPYYISTHAWPQASVAVLDHLADLADLDFDRSGLRAQIDEATASIQAMIDESPPLANVVTQLEQRFDELKKLEEGNMPSGDELEEEFQQYLRKIDDE